ncbi:MAG TPA: UbiA family prenyltransferase [Pyrinomonadaceae bacterium]|nr:UbiA family prenyltransferase [Pyrinomonadaceae bacterium]
MNKLIALMRCGSCRFAAYYFLPFYVALLSFGGGGRRWAVFGAAVWFLHSLGTELVNRLSDRVEDQINRPERTAYCEAVGFDRIKLISLLVWLTIVACDVAWVYTRPNPFLAALLVMGIMAGVGYSYGIRFKRKRYLSLLALTFPFGGPFLIGWASSGVIPADGAGAFAGLLRASGALLLVVGAFIGTLAGVKDITDIEGDDRVGYDSLWVSLIRRHATRVIFVMISLPFFITLVLVGARLLPPRFLALLLFMPVSLALTLCVRAAKENEQRQAVREALYHYWFVFLSAALFLYWPRGETLLVIMGSGVYWVLTTQYLHWSDGVSANKARALVSLFRQYRHRPASGVPLSP